MILDVGNWLCPSKWPFLGAHSHVSSLLLNHFEYLQGIQNSSLEQLTTAPELGVQPLHGESTLPRAGQVADVGSDGWQSSLEEPHAPPPPINPPAAAMPPQSWQEGAATTAGLPAHTTAEYSLPG